MTPLWRARLERSFLAVFARHQPQYRPEACVVTSASSRTALGLLAFHCGLTDVVFPDLSFDARTVLPQRLCRAAHPRPGAGCRCADCPAR